jgi:hypothetical protein
MNNSSVFRAAIWLNANVIVNLVGKRKAKGLGTRQGSDIYHRNIPYLFCRFHLLQVASFFHDVSV